VKPVNFGAGKAMRSRDSQDWTVRDCLEQLLAEIVSGETTWDRVFIVGVRDEENGSITVERWRAKLSRADEAHLLLIATSYLTRDSEG
jgi:hypothetical protein